MTTQEPVRGSEYDRGKLDGEVGAALARHENHFQRMNGSLDEMTAELHALAMSVQRLADLGDAREKTVKDTAIALKVADDQRRNAGDTKRAPLTLVIAAASVIVAAITAIISTYIATRGK